MKTYEIARVTVPNSNNFGAKSNYAIVDREGKLFAEFSGDLKQQKQDCLKKLAELNN